MIIIYILFWVIVIPIVAIALHVAIRYLNLSIQDRRHPRFHWDDEREKASPLMAAGNSKPPNVPRAPRHIKMPKQRQYTTKDLPILIPPLGKEQDEN